MRIALVTPGFSADHGDWCIPALYDLVRELAREHDVTVFALRYPHTRAPYRFHGARVHPFGAAQRGRLASGPALWGCLRSLLREGRTRGFDIVHGLWAGETGGIATRAAAALGIPSVVSLMGGELADLPDLDYGGFRARQPGVLGGLRAHARRASALASLRRANVVTAGSAFLSELADRRAGCRTRIMPLGVAVDRFSPQGERAGLPGAPAILMVGSLVPVKDHEVALAAFAALTGADGTGPALTIAGDGTLRAALQERVEQLGVADRVDLRGAVEHDALPALYRGADLCLLSSRHESQAMVVLEAAACGRLTVGTRVGLLPELTPSDWSAEPGDVAGLTAALGRAIAQTGEREHAAARATKRVREELTVARRAGALIDLYAELQHGRAGRQP